MAVAIRDKTTATQLMAVNADGSINVPALTKGTQGASGLSVQNLLDAGRNVICWTVDQFPAATAADTMLTVTASVNGAATSTYSSYTITSGKYLYLQSMVLTYEINGTTVATVRPIYVRFRVNTAGACVVASPIQVNVGVVPSVAYSTAAALLGGGASQEYVFQNGLSFLGNGTTSVGFSSMAPGWVTTTTLPK